MNRDLADFHSTSLLITDLVLGLALNLSLLLMMILINMLEWSHGASSSSTRGVTFKDGSQQVKFLNQSAYSLLKKYGQPFSQILNNCRRDGKKR